MSTDSTQGPTVPKPNDADRLRSLLDAHAAGGRPSGGTSELRSRLTSELIGSQVTLPDAVPLWHHLHRGGRELERVPYDGAALIVHNVEPAGSSFLVHSEDGQPHSRRGPAMTFRRPEDLAHEDLLVVFSTDLDC
ncbi:MAG: hypothetical protein QOE76_2843 [Frankiales bacterium]|jgi:hypothetical protein|nr:hypothetical protein [Frankiales bacterium]MDX6245120.1 hypothetical protein [Frankiales bacterium]